MHILAIIQWTTPLMLAGLFLLSLPLLAHLLNRRSRRRVIMPTIKFLQQSVAQQNHLLHLKRWLLLMLRCLAVALIVLAFARPIWWQGSEADRDQSLGVAIVVDASLSTSQSYGNTHVFQRILAAAERSLDQLEPGRDVASIIIARQTPQILVRKLSPNFPNLKSQLAEATFSYERADLTSAIAEANRQLDLHQGKKMLVVISDLQSTNWNETLPTLVDWNLAGDVQVRFVDIDLPATGNVGLAQAACVPPDPIDGQSIQLVVQATNYSDNLRQVPITVHGGTERLASQTLQVEPGQTAVATFATTFRSSFGNMFTFETSHDVLAADNRAFVEIKTGQQMPIALISDDAAAELGTAEFFMQRAVQPFNTDSDRFAVKSLPAAAIGAETLADFKIAIVGYVSSWDREAAEALVRFVDNGGNLLYLCGEGNVGQQTAFLQQVASQPFFPFLPARNDRFDDFDKAPFIASGQWRSRWLREFDLPSQLALRQIRFPRVWSVTNLQADADVLLTYSDDRPAVAVRNFGKGQIVLANLSPAVQYSDFGKYGSFVALVQILIRQLRDDLESESSPGHLVGQPLLFDSPAGDSDADDLFVVGPTGEPVASIVTGESSYRSLMVDRAVGPGFYQLRNDTDVLQTIAVNVDPRESDLQPIDVASLNQRLPNDSTSVAAAGGFTVDLKDQGTPLWGWLIAIGLSALALESIFLGWWKR